ncbi:MAG: 3'-phosphoesterase [Armatimonadetes bacterium]|nr:3'-phosphoesterase [Armatimonadota bacterium]
MNETFSQRQRVCRRTYQSSLFPRLEPHRRFVVHLHQATTLHYDFRFELGNALRDFVIPKGPSTNPLIRRLALSMRDHAKSLLDFEGRIQPQRYGAGPLLMWDAGLIVPLGSPSVSHDEAMWIGLECGYLEFGLIGRKLRGTWRLYRECERWFLQKLQDEYASAHDVRLDGYSIATGRTIDQL